MYRYLATRYLKRDPTPTKLGVQQYLAGRLSEVSPALVSNERKALASLFSFLHSEGLWPLNPLNGVGAREGEVPREAVPRRGRRGEGAGVKLHAEEGHREAEDAGAAAGDDGAQDK